MRLGVLLILLLLSTSLLVSPASTQVPPAPGACVAIPTTSVTIHREIRQSSPPDDAYPVERDDTVGYAASRSVDLDGDGTLDALVPEPSPDDCVQTMHVALYLVRGGCGHRLGVIEGRLDVAAMVSAPRAHGLPELVTTSTETVQDDPRVPAVQREHRRTYRFDGTGYRETARSHVDRVCHHCALERCAATIP